MDYHQISPEQLERENWEQAVERYSIATNQNIDTIIEQERFVGMTPYEIEQITVEETTN